MRKNYFLVALLAMFVTGVNAQFTDDMESYSPGTQIIQDWWTSWDGSQALGIFSSNAQAHTGGQSGLVDGSGIDPVLDFGNKIFGEWGLEFWMYVPAGKEGYFNFQGQVPIGAGEWIVGNIFFNEGSAAPGQGYIDYSNGDPAAWSTFTYPEGQWFQIVANIDLTSGTSAATWSFWVDGVEVVPAGTPFAGYDANGDLAYPSALGGMNLYSISANNEYYVDDWTLQDSFISLGAEDFATKGFSAYPNPVENVLNLRANEAINSVAIYNILGQEVYSAKVGAMTSQIDMSQMASGAYFVKVNINGTEGTVKVIK